MSQKSGYVGPNIGDGWPNISISTLITPLPTRPPIIYKNHISAVINTLGPTNRNILAWDIKNELDRDYTQYDEMQVKAWAKEMISYTRSREFFVIVRSQQAGFAGPANVVGVARGAKPLARLRIESVAKLGGNLEAIRRRLDAAVADADETTDIPTADLADRKARLSRSQEETDA